MSPLKSLSAGEPESKRGTTITALQRTPQDASRQGFAHAPPVLLHVKPHATVASASPRSHSLPPPASHLGTALDFHLHIYILDRYRSHVRARICKFLIRGTRREFTSWRYLGHTMFDELIHGSYLGEKSSLGVSMSTFWLLPRWYWRCTWVNTARV